MEEKMSIWSYREIVHISDASELSSSVEEPSFQRVWKELPKYRKMGIRLITWHRGNPHTYKDTNNPSFQGCSLPFLSISEQCHLLLERTGTKPQPSSPAKQAT